MYFIFTRFVVNSDHLAPCHGLDNLICRHASVSDLAALDKSRCGGPASFGKSKKRGLGDKPRIPPTLGT